ncbi:ABC transporter substrate-binding protein [Paenibacillus protaetiae]|uniref:Extracellular solute-binding protein n=1 Tax=Paenibacillus protaetiae TaxID=2509456 RepID=A0A4P6FBM6_9BACL|nr:extracellular solute-binding protein [Paenibacillus protaetiae]QAY67948.1 extracellular solute-binding protein [Paenibacillus protaetiae]
MKKSLLVSALLLLTLTVSACGGNNGNGGNNGGNKATPTPSASAEATAAPTPTPAADPVSLRVFSTFGGTDPAAAAFQALLDDFTKANPNVKITNDAMSANDDSFRTKVNTDMNSGNEPDLLFYFTGADADGFVKAGKVVPLNDLLDADAAWKGGFSPSALESVRQADGNIYGVPLTGYYEGLFVNKALFQKYNVELPTDYDKLKTAVQTFAKNGVIPMAEPFDQSHYLIEHSILAAAGPDGQKKGLLNGIDPNWEKGLAAVKELGDLGAFPKDASTIDLSMASNYFSQGLAAMIIEGSWSIGGWADDVKNNTTVLPFPAIPGGAGSGNDVVGGFGSGFYLSKATYDNAAKKDTAIKLMKFLTSPDAIQKIATANGGTPAADVKIDGLPQVALDGFSMVAKSASINSPIDSKVSPETFTTLRANIQKIVKGQTTPAKALEEAQKIEVANKK